MKVIMGKLNFSHSLNRASIIAYHKLNLSNNSIAKKLNISRRTVDYNIKKFKETGSLDRRRNRIYRRKTSPKEDQFIVQMVLRNRRLSIPDITAEINRIANKNISCTTVRRRLHEHGIFGRVAVKKPLLRSVNVKKRLEWAKKHKKWSIAKWKKVLFSDESKFEVFGTKRKVYVFRRANEKYLKDCLVPSVKHGGGSVMVWGCFAGSHVGDLVKVEGILNKEGYKKILEEHALPSGTRLIGNSFIFQQDNDPKHSAKMCRSYLENLEKKRKLKVMVWPPQSPDLNPIELLWDELNRAVQEKRPKSISALWKILQEEWGNMNATTLDKLISRMPRICKAVIKSKGYHFDEKKV